MEYQNNGLPHRGACPSVGLEAQAPIKFPDVRLHKLLGFYITKLGEGFTRLNYSRCIVLVLEIRSPIAIVVTAVHE